MLHFGMRTISRASSRDSCFCEPASLRGCHLSVGLAAQSSDQSSTGEPVIERPWVQEDRNLEIRNGWGNLESTTPEGTIKTLRVVQPCSGSLGELASRSLSATRLSSFRLSHDGRRKKTLGFASLPRGRFAFIGAIKN